MSNEIENLSRRRIAIDVLATVSGIVSIVVFVFTGRKVAAAIGVYGLLMGTSTAVVTYCLTQFTGVMIENGEEHEGQEQGEQGEQGERGPEEQGPNTLLESGWEIFTGRALETDSDVKKDTGWLIGRIENTIILTLVVAGQYTALSIIFAAKSWVRVEDTANENSTYYLAGTMVNFTYSIVVAIVAVLVLGLF